MPKWVNRHPFDGEFNPGDGEGMTKRAYNLLLSDLYSDGNWFRCSYDFFRILGMDEAVVWAFLVNQDRLARTRDRYDGWFHCGLEDFTKRFPRIGERTQYRILKRLKQYGLLRIEKRGVPAKRYFQINLEWFRSMVEDSFTDHNKGIRSSPDKTAETRPDKPAESDSLLRREYVESSNTKELPRIPSGIRGDSTEENGMLFDTDNPPDENKQPPSAEKEDHRCAWADRLRKCVVAAKATKGFRSEKRTWSGGQRAKWANEFRKLETKVGAERIERSLSFYEKKVAALEKPKITNVPHFGKVIEWLEDLMAKEPVEVKLDRRLKGVAETVRSWGWPTKAKGQIDAAVQLTFDALNEFQAKLRDHCHHNPQKPGRVGHHDNFAHHLLDVIGGFGPYGGIKGLTESWLEGVHADKAGWADWNQELVRCVPKPGIHDKKFNEWGRKIADEWSDAKIWDKLMGYLYPKG